MPIYLHPENCEEASKRIWSSGACDPVQLQVPVVLAPGSRRVVRRVVNVQRGIVVVFPRRRFPLQRARLSVNLEDNEVKPVPTLRMTIASPTLIV